MKGLLLMFLVHQVHEFTEEGDEVALAFLDDEKLVAGTRDSVRRVIDIFEDADDPISMTAEVEGAAGSAVEQALSLLEEAHQIHVLQGDGQGDVVGLGGWCLPSQLDGHHPALKPACVQVQKSVPGTALQYDVGVFEAKTWQLHLVQLDLPVEFYARITAKKFGYGNPDRTGCA